MAELIRSKANKPSRQQRDEKRIALQKEREKCRTLREENSTLEERLSRMASINARLMVEIQQLKAINKSPKVTVLK